VVTEGVHTSGTLATRRAHDSAERPRALPTMLVASLAACPPVGHLWFTFPAEEARWAARWAARYVPRWAETPCNASYAQGVHQTDLGHLSGVRAKRRRYTGSATPQPAPGRPPAPPHTPCRSVPSSTHVCTPNTKEGSACGRQHLHTAHTARPLPATAGRTPLHAKRKRQEL